MSPRSRQRPIETRPAGVVPEVTRKALKRTISSPEAEALDLQRLKSTASAEAERRVHQGTPREASQSYTAWHDAMLDWLIAEAIKCERSE